jgi:hypothetical protein
MPYISVPVVGELDIECPQCGAGVDHLCSITQKDLDDRLAYDDDEFHIARSEACCVQVPVHGPGD